MNISPSQHWDIYNDPDKRERGRHASLIAETLRAVNLDRLSDIASETYGNGV